ncbi:Uncharacterised protein [Bordetella pertussis]|nr:Uncharacterised protein [Bordetella pertussis]
MPAPLGPMMPNTSPCWMCRLMPRSASKRPCGVAYVLDRFSI